MLALAKKVTPRNQVATSITANPIATAGTAVRHGMAVHQGAMTMIINLVQLHGRIASAIKSKVSRVKSKGMLGERACTIATRRSGIEEETTTMMIKTIDIGIHGTQDPDTMQPEKIDGTIAAILATTLEVTTLRGTAIEPLNTDEPIALARSVDRRRRAAIVNRRAADAIST